MTNGRVSATAEIMTARSCRDAVESRPDLITDQNLKLNLDFATLDCQKKYKNQRIDNDKRRFNQIYLIA